MCPSICLCVGFYDCIMYMCISEYLYIFVTDVLCAMWTCGPCVRDDLSRRSACNCRGTPTKQPTQAAAAPKAAPKKVFAPIHPLLATVP